MTLDYGYTQSQRWLPNVEKDPDSSQAFIKSWARELNGETISTSAWNTDGLTNDSDSNSTSTVTIQLAGGTDGQQYEVENTITTSGGMTLKKRLIVMVRKQ